MTHLRRAYRSRVTAPRGSRGRRHYARERLARTLVAIYLGVVVLSAIPFATEELTDTESGGFGFVWLMLSTAPLSFAAISLTPPFEESDRMTDVLLAAAIVVPALINAWVVWRISRGPAVVTDGPPAPSIR